MVERRSETTENTKDTRQSFSGSEGTIKGSEARVGSTRSGNGNAKSGFETDFWLILCSSALLGILVSLHSVDTLIWLAFWTVVASSAALLAFTLVRRLLERRGTTAKFFALTSMLLLALNVGATMDWLDRTDIGKTPVLVSKEAPRLVKPVPAVYEPASESATLVSATMGMQEMRLPEHLAKNNKLAFILKDIIKEGRLTIKFEVPEQVAEDIQKGKYLKNGNVLEAVDPDLQARVIRFVIKSIKIITETQDPETIMVLIGRELYQELAGYFSQEKMDDRLVKIQQQLDRIEGYLVARHLATIKNAHDCVKKAQVANDDMARIENYKKAIDFFQAFRNENKYLHRGRGHKVGKELSAVCNEGWLAPTKADFDSIYGSVRDFVGLYTVINYCATAEIMLHEQLGQMSIARELRLEALDQKINFLSFVGCFMSNSSEGLPTDCSPLNKNCFYAKVKEIAQRGTPDQTGAIDSRTCAEMWKKISKQRNALKKDLAELHKSLIVDLVCITSAPPGTLKLAVEKKPRKSFVQSARAALHKVVATLDPIAE